VSRLLSLLDFPRGVIIRKAQYRKDIQVLRGLAVLAVVLFHAKESYFPLGYLGVDVFFVISGFVVTPLILRIFTDEANGGGRLSNLKYFYKRRFYRLAPAMLLTLSLSAILVLLLISPTSFEIFGEQMIFTIFFVGNYGAFKIVGDYFNNSGNPLVHTWSLAVEEQIYIFLPLLMLLLFARQKNINKISILTMAIITSVSLCLFLSPTILQPAYESIGISDSTNVFFYSPLHRIWQFTIGGSGFLLMKNRGRQGIIKCWTNHVLIFFLLILIFGSLPFGPRSGSFAASLITVLIVSFRSLETIPGKPTLPFEWLGDRSYSIYLFHMPFLFIANTAPYFSQIRSNEFVVPMAVLLSIFFGAISYSHVENRYRIGQASSRNLLSSLNVISTLLILSLLLSFFMIRGSNNEYWGLQREIDQPPAAWNLDGNCSRMSDQNELPCIYKNIGATKTVLLIGDSHAAQFSQAITEASQKAKWNSAIWTMGSCHFALSDKNAKISNYCLNRNSSILNWVKDNQPSLVIISQYNRIELSQSEMKLAVNTIKTLVTNVLVIGNTPIFPDDRYMAVPALLQKKYYAPKKIKISHMDNTNDNVSSTFLEEIETKGIEVVKLNSLWCTKGYCSRFNKQGWLFFDKGHLSVFGAEMSVPYFTKFLNNH
jgi:peptidoglycan/LPS O-acetylase OafA/YrhL